MVKSKQKTPVNNGGFPLEINTKNSLLKYNSLPVPTFNLSGFY